MAVETPTRAISGLPGRLVKDGIVSEEKMLEVLDETRESGVTVVSYLVKNELAGQSKMARKPAAARDPNIQTLENTLSDTLGAAVNIRHGKGQKGRIEIPYSGLDELDGILRKLGVRSGENN